MLFAYKIEAKIEQTEITATALRTILSKSNLNKRFLRQTSNTANITYGTNIAKILGIQKAAASPITSVSAPFKGEVSVNIIASKSTPNKFEDHRQTKNKVEAIKIARLVAICNKILLILTPFYYKAFVTVSTNLYII